MQSINSHEVIQNLITKNSSVPLLDVRSEGEFAQGALPGFINCPVLTDAERHKVGLCYKQKGQAQAIELGLSLFNPVKTKRVASWTSHGPTPWILCWRGGLRSRLSTEFIREAGFEALQIRGGYKAIRTHLLKSLALPPPLVVLSGFTGSGKTDLLPEIPQAIDLEKHALHRGSAFGAIHEQPQPAQASFENALALDFLKNDKGAVVEDECALIGRITLPFELKNKMNTAPTCILESSVEERAQRIWTSYIQEPLQRQTPEDLETRLQHSLLNIRNRLGGLLHSQISKEMSDAFRGHPQNHIGWISELLTYYYDKLYENSLQRSERKIEFRGNKIGCLQWIQNQFASLKP